MKYYHVLLLADVCPSHYMSAPGLSWDVMLKMIKIKLELITWLDLNKYIINTSKGCILEVDLEYPK